MSHMLRPGVQALAEARAWRGKAQGLALAAGSTPNAARIVEGARGIKMTVTANAMRGRALQVASIDASIVIATGISPCCCRCNEVPGS